MKKIFSILAAIVMVASMALSVYAAYGLGDSFSEKVTATYESGTSGVVYSVDLAWQGMSFTYIDADAPIWDPVNHKYPNSTVSGGWAASNAKVTVTNHSNSAILASFDYKKVSGYETAGVAFDATQLVVASAETNARAESGSVRVKPNGSLTETATGGKIGEITVTITPALDISAKTVDEITDIFVTYIDANKDANNAVFLPAIAASNFTTSDLVAVCDNLTSKYATTVSVDLLLAGVTSFGEAACTTEYYIVWLKSVTLPDVISVGNEALSYCTTLKEVDLPKATTIGEHVLSYCPSLEQIRFGTALVSVSGSCFAYTSGTSTGGMENITLYLSADQTVMKPVTTNNVTTWIPTTESYWTSEDYQNKTFCGYTFKEIKEYKVGEEQ